MNHLAPLSSVIKSSKMFYDTQINVIKFSKHIQVHTFFELQRIQSLLSGPLIMYYCIVMHPVEVFLDVFWIK